MRGFLGRSVITSESAIFTNKCSEFMIAKHFGNSTTKLQRKKGIRQNEDGILSFKMQLGGMGWFRH